MTFCAIRSRLTGTSSALTSMCVCVCVCVYKHAPPKTKCVGERMYLSIRVLYVCVHVWYLCVIYIQRVCV